MKYYCRTLLFVAALAQVLAIEINDHLLTSTAGRISGTVVSLVADSSLTSQNEKPHSPIVVDPMFSRPLRGARQANDQQNQDREQDGHEHKAHEHEALESDAHERKTHVHGHGEHEEHSGHGQHGEHVDEHGEHEEHGEHHEHGEHGGSTEHAHHHHTPPPAHARAYSMALMGSVTFVIFLFYLVNHHDPDIVLSTWRTLSMTVSIFSAVLIYGTLKTLTLDVLYLLGITANREVDAAVCCGMFCIFYVSLQAFLFKLRGKAASGWGHSVGVIGAHVTGFAAMFGLAGLMAVNPCNGDKVMMILYIILAILFQAFLVNASMEVDKWIASKEHLAVEESFEWLEECEEAEDDIVSLCISYNITAVVRALITGEFKPYELVSVPNHNQMECWILLICGTVFGLLSVIGSAFRPRFEKFGPATSHCVRVTVTVLGMAEAWMVLFWIDWQLYALGYNDVRIAAFLMEALALTLVAIVIIFCLDYISDRIEAGETKGVFDSCGLRYMIISIGVLVGFAWERCFDVAIEDIAHSGSLLDMSPGITNVIMAAILLLAVLPAWHKYIMPQAQQSKIV